MRAEAKSKEIENTIAEKREQFRIKINENKDLIKNYQNKKKEIED